MFLFTKFIRKYLVQIESKNEKEENITSTKSHINLYGIFFYQHIQIIKAYPSILKIIILIKITSLSTSRKTSNAKLNPVCEESEAPARSVVPISPEFIKKDEIYIIK